MPGSAEQSCSAAAPPLLGAIAMQVRGLRSDARFASRTVHDHACRAPFRWPACCDTPAPTKETNLNVSELMTTPVTTCANDDSLQRAAQLMWEGDCGAVPVVHGEGHLVGMITDRDITIRAVAEGRSGETLVRDVMTRDVQYCFETDDVDEAASKMSQLRVRRLPVLNKDRRLVGVISLGDIWRTDEGDSEKALGGIARPGGPHAM